MIIARTRRDVAELNRLARRRVAAAGVLGSDEMPLFGQGFAAGDRVVIRRNDLGAGVHNGDRCQVLAVDARRQQIVVAVDGRGIRSSSTRASCCAAPSVDIRRSPTATPSRATSPRA